MTDDRDESVCVKSCATQQEAEVVRALLESGGVSARISADEYVGLPLQTSGGVQVFVLESDLRQAQAILEAATDGHESD